MGSRLVMTTFYCSHRMTVPDMAEPSVVPFVSYDSLPVSLSANMNSLRLSARIP